jgi:UDP-N-acetylglucosamine 1-carboxyvinyltransferase
VKYLVSGGKKLEGQVSIAGAKNSILPILAASLLSKGICSIHNLPQLRDVEMMGKVLEYLGARFLRKTNSSVDIDSSGVSAMSVTVDLMRMLRASNLVMGPLLSRFGEVRVPFPGGCDIGSRPMDLHLKAFEKMGAKITDRHGFIYAKALSLSGADIHLDFPSVGATENIMMAGTLANGTTIIRNAAREPEIVDLQNFLNGTGAKIKGAGTDTIRIDGVPELRGGEHSVIPDRIEAGTYLLAGAISGGKITLTDVIPEHLEPVIAKLREMGAVIYPDSNKLHLVKSTVLKPVDIKTLPYPGFPTDMQAQMMALLATVPGSSLVIETIFENRYKHVSELRRMGANIKIEGRAAIIKGVENLSGTVVTATDLRAGAALILAGLSAQGETLVENGQFIQRGYDNIDIKLRQIGADIQLVK